jgi:ABC-2 type transport system ATP-binding protein
VEKATTVVNSPVPATPALQVSRLGKRYGSVTAVEDVSFEVRHGEIVGLLGPNGAGKTTTIDMILSVLEPDSGRISIEGIDVGARRKAALSRTNFAAVYATLPGNLSVQQNLRVFGMIYGVRNLGRRIDTVLAQFDLEQLRHTRCGLLSSGEQMRVGVAKALLNAPGLLLLDEPTASLDPASAQAVRAHLRAVATEQACGILWTSHNMYEVEAVCDRVLFLSRGRILLEGDPRVLPGQHGAANLEELFISIARERLTGPTAAVA